MRFVAVLSACLAVAGCAAQAAPHHLGAVPMTTSSDVEAAAYRGGRTTSVTAESRYGHGSVTGPVRQGPRGTLEVRMPGGSWIECGRVCSETLRRETVDFWESRGGKNDPADGPAYFSRGW